MKRLIGEHPMVAELLVGLIHFRLLIVSCDDHVIDYIPRCGEKMCRIIILQPITF